MKVSVRPIWLPSGTPQIRFRPPKKSHKKEVRITLPKTLTKKEVERECAHYARQIMLGAFDPWESKSKAPYLSQAVSLYIKKMSSTNWNTVTTKGTSIRLKQMRDNLMDQPLDKITDWEWWEQPQWADHTKKGFYTITKAFLNWCVKQGYIKDFELQLSRQTRIGSNKKPLKAITIEQLEDICSAYRWQTAVNKRLNFTPKHYDEERHIQLWHVIFKLLLRKSEIAQVKLTDVEQDHINIIRKGGKHQRLYIYHSVKPHIDWFRENQVEGKPFFGFESMRSPYIRLQKAARLALGDQFEGTYGFHMFRHGGITHMIKENVSIPVVSEYAGHASVSITLDRYAHVIDTHKKDQLDSLK